MTLRGSKFDSASEVLNTSTAKLAPSTTASACTARWRGRACTPSARRHLLSLPAHPWQRGAGGAWELDSRRGILPVDRFATVGPRRRDAIHPFFNAQFAIVQATPLRRPSRQRPPSPLRGPAVDAQLHLPRQ